jgi:hypothetical protein
LSEGSVREEFLQAMKEMKRIRQRDGAIGWNLLRDSAEDTLRFSLQNRGPNI